MPSIPSSQCAHYQCKAPSIRGSVYCIEHAPTKQVSKTRQAFNAPYKTAAWAAIRARQLSTLPLCAACLIDGRITAASHVDHVYPWAVIGDQAFTRNLFQSLCPECHGVKSGLEKRGVFRHYTHKAHDYTAHDYPFTMMQA
jgi:5-methylcytosine-specific restriction protein A